MKHRVGIVGLGSIASKVYLPLLCAHNDVEVVGLASRRAETVEGYGEQYRIPNRFTNLQDLLALRPEIVFVHSSTESHFDVVTTCLRAGVNVYVDKPLSYDIVESEEMAALAKERGLLLAVGFNRRFAPLYRQAQAWMEEGGGFDLALAHKRRTSPQQMSSQATVHDDLIHLIDLLVWLGGGTAELLHYAHRADGGDRLLTAAGTIRLGQATAQFGMQRTSGVNGERLELHGGGRSAEVVDLERGIFGAGGERRIRELSGWETVSYRRGFAGMINHVFESLRAPEACEVGAELVLRTHRLCDQLHPPSPS